MLGVMEHAVSESMSVAISQVAPTETQVHEVPSGAMVVLSRTLDFKVE